jgi:hypothetical protein
MDSCSVFLVVVIVLVVIIGVSAWVASRMEAEKLERMAPEERAAYLEAKRRAVEAVQLKAKDSQRGPLNPQMICPHCQSKGTVRTKKVTQKKGISGGKATAAVLTAGVSILATGLSRKEGATEAHCDNCGSTWYFGAVPWKPPRVACLLVSAIRSEILLRPVKQNTLS